MTPVRAPDADPGQGAGRLFLGIPLPDAVRRSLADHLFGPDRAALPGRVVPPANWHLTLRFLGAATTLQLERLRVELHATNFHLPFDAELGGFGAFPRPARASVLWLGVARGVEPLAGLAGDVERAARAAGFSPETRPFRAHLTLSRLRPPGDIRTLLAHLPPFGAVLPVTEVVLFRSHLGSGPPRYEPVARFGTVATERSSLGAPPADR